MAGVRTQLARTRRLEAAKVHPILAALGGEDSWANIQSDTQAGICEGLYDSRDMPGVLAAIRLWLKLP